MMSEWIDTLFGQSTGNKVKGQIEIGEGEVGEEKLAELVDEFNVQENLASDGVVGRQNLSELDERVNGRKKGTVEPSSTLGNKFRDGI